MRIIVFVDANILAKPVTRTLVLVGSRVNGAEFSVVWSQLAEFEAEHNLKSATVSISQIRLRYGFDLSPSGVGSGNYEATAFSDRQILADAFAAGAGLLLTEDVDDFGLVDLEATGIVAISPDLFLANYLSESGYLTAVEAMRWGRPAHLVHSALGKLHPLLVRKFTYLFPDAEIAQPTHNPPAVLLRGNADKLDIQLKDQ